MDALVISLVSARTALVASIVGPLVTLAVARRQFNATVLSANRQRWIEALRDTVAELISLLVAGLVVKSQWQDKPDHQKLMQAIDVAVKRVQSEAASDKESEADILGINSLRRASCAANGSA